MIPEIACAMACVCVRNKRVIARRVISLCPYAILMQNFTADYSWIQRFLCAVLSLFLNCQDHFASPVCAAFIYWWGYGLNHTAILLLLCLPLCITSYLHHLKNKNEPLHPLSISRAVLQISPRCIVIQICSAHLWVLNKRPRWLPVSIWILLKPHAAICSLTTLWYLKTTFLSSAPVCQSSLDPLSV